MQFPKCRQQRVGAALHEITAREVGRPECIQAAPPLDFAIVQSRTVSTCLRGLLSATSGRGREAPSGRRLPAPSRHSHVVD